jgi:hypothetical protein
MTFLVLGGAVALVSLRPHTEEVLPAAAPIVSGLPVAGVPEVSSTEPVAPVVFAPRINMPTPSEVRGVYLTGWSAGSPVRRAATIALMEKLGLNTVVVDIKDYSGYVSYKMPNVPEVAAVGADREVRIADPDAMLRDFHSKGIYVIGRVTVFQDPIFAAGRPDLALTSSSTGKTWYDNKGLAWLDAAGEDTWIYVEDIAKDGFARGFDEINFDYIRFPSDGSLKSAIYPFYKKTDSKHAVIGRFFTHLRTALQGEVISADLFGLTASAADDLGIGQVIEDAFPNFDYISPMVYPSHFANGSYGYKNPADVPYQIIQRSMSDAISKRNAYMLQNPGAPAARLRPWFQAFDLGARYDKAKIEAQIEGAKAAFASSTDASDGWLFWDPKNTYTDL